MEARGPPARTERGRRPAQRSLGARRRLLHLLATPGRRSVRRGLFRRETYEQVAALGRGIVPDRNL